MGLFALLCLIGGFLGYIGTENICGDLGKKKNIRMEVMEYFYQHQNEYNREKWFDILLDYSIETKSNAKLVFEAFDSKFINSEVREVSLPI